MERLKPRVVLNERVDSLPEWLWSEDIRQTHGYGSGEDDPAEGDCCREGYVSRLAMGNKHLGLA